MGETDEEAAIREAIVSAFATQTTIFWAVFSGPDMVITAANSVYVAMTGNRDIIGKPLHDAMPELRGQGFDVLIERVRSTGEPYVTREHSTFIAMNDGAPPEERFYDFTYTRLAAKGVVYDSVIVVGHDVTDAVRARRYAEQRSKLEEQLIGIVSHDLRNPLSVITLSSAALVKDESLGDRGARAAARIQLNADRALRLVHDLLDFTRVRLGSGIPIHRVPSNLHVVVDHAVEAASLEHPTRELTVTHEGDGDGSLDAERLGQAVGNLLANALKYSPAGTPVRVVTRGDDGVVTLSVHNGGDPIPLERHADVFLPLKRSVNEVGNTGRSVGLGLYIVKSIVDGHHGSVTLESTAEAGTTFTMSLPRH